MHPHPGDLQHTPCSPVTPSSRTRPPARWRARRSPGSAPCGAGPRPGPLPAPRHRSANPAAAAALRGTGHAGDGATRTPPHSSGPTTPAPTTPSLPTLTGLGAAISAPQLPRRLHEDVKKPLQVRGAGAVLRVELDAAQGVRQGATPHPLGPTPPRPCAHLKKGLCWWTRPSLEPSLALVKSGAQSGGRLLASTAKPWFCAVMKQRRVSSCTHGWLCPRFPYLAGARRVSGSSGQREPHGDLDPTLRSLHLVGVGTDGQREQLVPQADPEDGLGLGGAQHPAQVGHRLLAELRVPGAVADEQAIEVWAETTAGSEWGPPDPSRSTGSQQGPGYQLHGVPSPQPPIPPQGHTEVP